MNGKTYLVIGGSSGIGLETCKLLAAQGNSLMIVSSSEEKLQAVSEEIENQFGCPCVFFPHNLDDLQHVEEIFEGAAKAGLLFDGMVYSAGISPLQLVVDNDWKLAERVFRINVLAFIECVRCFYDERFSAEGSKIVAISSVTAKASGYRQTLYGSSKAALISAVKLMAKEMLNRGIKINCLSPGCTDTEMLNSLYSDKESLDDAVAKIQPLGVIPAVNVAQLVMELLSPLSDYLTGSEIVYDAGFFLK